MLGGFVKAVAQLGEPRFRRVLITGVLISLGVFVALTVVLNAALIAIDLSSFGLLEYAVNTLGGLAIVFIALLLFPGIIGIVMSFFLESAAEAVEATHYPELPAAPGQSISAATWASMKFSLVTLSVNLMVLPFYLIAFFIPPLSLLLYYGVNGVLMGREYFETVALRRLSNPQADMVRKRSRGQLFTVGAVTAFLFTIPVVNLFAPLIATAWMVHVLMRTGAVSGPGGD